MNLLRLFEFYLMAMFVISTMRRLELYRAVIQLVIALARRYQKLLGKVTQHSGAFLTMSIFIPMIGTLLLWLIQIILTRVVFPDAELLASNLSKRWWCWPAVIIPALLVVTIDTYFLIRVGKIDADETEKYFSPSGILDRHLEGKRGSHCDPRPESTHTRWWTRK